MTGSGQENASPAAVFAGPLRRTHVAVADGARIALTGAGHGPVVLFLHGIGGSARQWEGALRHLSPRYCALAWDARGYGASTGAPVNRFGDFADDLFAVLDGLGVERALLVGHSMGGRILLEAARRDQSRFAALVLSGAQSAYLEHMSDGERRAYVERRHALFDGEAMSREAAARVARSVLAPDTAPDQVEAMVESFMHLDRAGYLAALAASVGMDARDVLGRIAVPTRVVGGALDPVCPADESVRIAEAIGQEPAVLMEGVAHMAILEAPEAFLRIVEDFLARHAGRASTASADTLPGGTA